MIERLYFADLVPNLTKPDIAAAIAKRPVSAELT